MDDNSQTNSVGQIKIKDFAKITQVNPSSSKKVGNNRRNTVTNINVTPGSSRKGKKRANVKNAPLTSSDEETDTKTPAKRNKRRVTTTDIKNSNASPVSIPPKRSTVKKSAKVKDLKEPPANNKLISQFFKPISQLPSTETKLKIELVKARETIKKEEISGKENEMVMKPNKDPEKPVPMVVIPKARRRLCPGTNLKLVSNRYHDDDQTRMSEFYDKTKECAFNYYTTTDKSKLPAIIDGELDVASCLGICLTEESRILDFNDSQEDADKPDEQVQREIVKLLDRIQNPVNDEADDERDRWNMEMEVEAVQNLTQKRETIPDTTPRKRKGPRVKKTVICPKYKIISGTTFAVDAFRFGCIDGISHYFLTHFHSDHYIGLKKDFSRPIILSSVTAACVLKFVKVDPQFLIRLDPNETMTINDIKITAIDANQ